MRGQRELGVDLEGKPTGYLGARVSKRLCTDLFARGVCRGAVECANLLLHAESKDPTSAESIKTAPLTDIALVYPIQLLQAVRAQEHWPKETTRAIVDKRCDTARKITECPFWTVYGARGRHPKARDLKRLRRSAVSCHPIYKVWLVYILYVVFLAYHHDRYTCFQRMSSRGNSTSIWRPIH